MNLSGYCQKIGEEPIKIGNSMSIFDEIAVMRQLTFKDGDIELMGNRVVIIHANFLYDYCLKINDSPEKVHELYETSKSSFRVGIAESIGKAYGFSFHDFFKWMTKIAMLAGWGTLKYELLDEEKKIARITVDNSPVAEHLKEKVNNPVDHFIRGFIAGAATAAFKTDVDAIEEECMALGAERCKFLFKPANTFESSPETIYQLGR